MHEHPDILSFDPIEPAGDSVGAVAPYVEALRIAPARARVADRTTPRVERHVVRVAAGDELAELLRASAAVIGPEGRRSRGSWW